MSISEGLEQQEGNSPTSLLHNRDYLLLLGGQALSSTGTQLSQFAFPLLVLAFTGSSAWTGVAAGLVALPYFFLALPAGVWLDRWNRRHTMILCDIGRALCLGSIPVALFLGKLTLLQLCVCALLEGSFFTFFDIAETASIPRVVTKAQLSRAQAQKGTVMNVAYMVGPLLGGALFALGRAFPFLADALSYVVSVFSLLCIKRRFQADRVALHQSLRIEVWEGIQWLWHQKLIRMLALLASVGNAVDNGIFIFFLVVLSRQHASPLIIGSGLMIACLAGALGAYLSERALKFPFGPFVIATQVISLVLLPLYFFFQSIIGVIAVTTVYLFFSSLQGTAAWSYRAIRIPDDLQGRVNSVFRLIGNAMVPLGMALTGLLLQRGSAAAVLVFTIIVGVVTVMTIRNAHVRHAPAFGSED